MRSACFAVCWTSPCSQDLLHGRTDEPGQTEYESTGRSDKSGQLVGLQEGKGVEFSATPSKDRFTRRVFTHYHGRHDQDDDNQHDHHEDLSVGTVDIGKQLW